MPFDVNEFRKSFPQLERTMGPNSLVYFDSGASTLKHSKVTDRLNQYNRFETANVHRGAHHVSRQGTEAYESAREQVAQFLGAEDSREIIFTRGTTEGINLVAHGLKNQLKPGDEVLISPFEHHSNIVPWQVLCRESSCTLRVLPFDRERGLVLDDLETMISEKTRIVALNYYSNSFGNRLNIEKILNFCKGRGIISLIDGAQAVLTEKINVAALDCDFFVFSGHKLFGPYGVGGLFGRMKLLEAMEPYQTGGSMIDRVQFTETRYAEVPQKFEAGTPHIAGAIGLGVAVEVASGFDFPSLHAHILELRKLLKEGLESQPGLKIYDFPAEDYTGTLSFNIGEAHPSDVGTLLDKYGFAVRAGHHCTQPLMDLMEIPGTVRVSLAPYNTRDEVIRFISTVEKVKEFF